LGKYENTVKRFIQSDHDRVVVDKGNTSLNTVYVGLKRIVDKKYSNISLSTVDGEIYMEKLHSLRKDKDV
jgi:hypothetical protein